MPEGLKAAPSSSPVSLRIESWLLKVVGSIGGELKLKLEGSLVRFECSKGLKNGEESCRGERSVDALGRR